MWVPPLNWFLVNLSFPCNNLIFFRLGYFILYDTENMKCIVVCFGKSIYICFVKIRNDCQWVLKRNIILMTRIRWPGTPKHCPIRYGFLFSTSWPTILTNVVTVETWPRIYPSPAPPFPNTSRF
jgi:hypothetical protein